MDGLLNIKGKIEREIMKLKYTIDRSKWVCGGDTTDKLTGRFSNLGDAQLLNNYAKMCCLGQICHIGGVPKGELLNEGEPDQLENRNVPGWLLEKGSWHVHNSTTAEKMMNINDDPNITQAEREGKLKKIARKAGVILQFIGKLGGIRSKR